MQKRKYFNYKIVELEEVFKNAGGDCAVLEELEEELTHRSTQRALGLLKKIQESLNGVEKSEISLGMAKSSNIKHPVTQSASSNNKTANEIYEYDTQIDWDKLLSADLEIANNFGDQEISRKPLDNRPQNILDTWVALEALSPQVYKKPNDLIIGQGSVAYLKKGLEPWLKGEKSIPKNNLYYLAYFGSVDLVKATNQLLKIYHDKYTERSQVKGFAALGVVLLDKKGVPVPENGLAVSSFGWAYMMAMKGKLNELKLWKIAEKSLIEGLKKIIYQENEEGKVLPFSLCKANMVFNWIIQNCEIHQSECIAPSFAIRLYQPFSKGEPETPLLNSFFLDDLQRAKETVDDGKCGKALSRYLGITKPEAEYDVLKDKTHIEKALEPKNMPLARWPGKGRHSLVLLQQMAVNLALHELQRNGIFSVNGPPGTGKTTLLRDVVAAIIVERSKALFKFKEAEDAFEPVGKMKLGNSFVHLYKLDFSLCGHEMVVASSNNKAVENISKELPRRSQIARDIEGLNYFKTLSDELTCDGDNTETWGIIAAVLGNAKNRSAFINKAWWDNNSALQKYFKYITGQLSIEIDKDGGKIIPNIIKECDPPENLNDAKVRWEKAKKKFSEAINAAENIKTIAQNAYKSYYLIGNLKAEISNNQAKQIKLRDCIQFSNEKEKLLSDKLKQREAELNTHQERKKHSLSQKPSFFKRLFSHSKWKIWQNDHQIIVSKLVELRQDYNDVLTQLQEADKYHKTLEVSLIKCQSEEKNLEEKLHNSLARLEKYTNICGDKLVTPDLWLLCHEEQQSFIPNFKDQAQRLRDDVFIAAVKLHKAFIDASSIKLRQNLAAYFACLGGRSLPHDKQHLLPHLWSSLFLIVPVISTTFASVGRMLGLLPKESLGWLLIDEAGQTPPQQAVGSIYRAKRVLSVGDPLQIEPVVTLPSSILEGISRHIGVDPTEWTAPDASVQTLTDKANSYGTIIPRDLSEIRIGAPLLVHRRCENPMFSISNKLAYGGLMVYATITKKSEITDFFGEKTSWFNVHGSAEEKWCPEEGEQVSNMLLSACKHFQGDPNIFVITPFRIVAEKMRRRMECEKERLLQFGISDPDDWIYNNIGTVHTFQGKEANAVILLLGASNPSQNGARSWATNNVNLLNVAVSRAKHNFYVVGNRELWAGIGNMKLVAQNI